ncbi:hypothetical protein NQ176_g235 [Zarea fungicola]|uniref:Uncharacterized protein n=1 Tax=Zarea fungicola TaxID=93591 RepID=A0ACC1NXK7_9HYPO|nr:hypothetical protein NQ176_g235 [Lecanicillium fungicola]
MKINSALMALAALASSGVFALPTESSPKKWTFRDLHQYAVTHGGADHPLAADIEARMLSDDYSQTWETEYDDSITSDDGGVLVTPGSALVKRAGSSLTAYLFSSNCDANDVQFTWNDSSDGCHTFNLNGKSHRMYSVKATSSIYPNAVGWPTDLKCHRGIFDNFGNIGKTDGQCHFSPNGWVGWNWPNA